MFLGHAPRYERGAALVLALVATMVLTGLGIGLVLSMMVEGSIASAFGTAQTNFYAAESGLEWGIRRLSAASDWDPALGDAAAAYFAGGAAHAVAVDVPALTFALQRTSDLRYGSGPNRPVWRLLGHGPLAGLTGAADAVPYVLVWVADDPGERDGAPDRDSNGIITIHAEAWGTRESRRVVEATLMRDAGEGGESPGRVRVVEWRERREGI